MNILSTGAVLPSGLLSEDTASSLAGFNKAYQNFALRAGIIIKTYTKDNKDNIGKLFDEYDVLVFEQDTNRAVTPIIYKHCISSEGFGAIADFFEARLRSGKKKKDPKRTDSKGQDGALVLILCLDGSGDKGIIIGALPHPDRKTNLTGEEPQLVAEYNGVRIQVESDGSARVTFKGATDNQGIPKDSKQGTATIDIEKDASVQIKNENVQVRYQRDGQVTLGAKKDITYKTDAGYLLNSADSVKVDARDGKLSQTVQDFLLEASGSATLNAQSFKFAAKSEFAIKAQMLNVEAGSMAKIKSGQITLDGKVFVGGPGGTPAVLLTTKFLGVGNLGAPILCQAVGPFATNTFIK